MLASANPAGGLRPRRGLTVDDQGISSRGISSSVSVAPRPPSRIRSAAAKALVGGKVMGGGWLLNALAWIVRAACVLAPSPGGAEAGARGEDAR